MLDPYSRTVNPALGSLFLRLGLDTEMTRGQGAHLFDASGQRYVDMTASYGALPLGHAHPRLVEAVGDFLSRGSPQLVKGRTNHPAGRAGEALCTRFGADQVIFGNSGAEAVDVALKAARAATGRHRVLTFEGSYHGTTGSALACTGNAAFRAAFPDPSGQALFVPRDPERALALLEAHASELAAVLVEPIQGEAGVIHLGQPLLASLRERCDHHGIWLVVDEIQTGLGRSGEMSKSLAWGIRPDLLLLSKGLGGGLVPVGATLAYRPLPRSMFELHSSTYAGNALGMRLVQEVLSILDEPFLEQVRQRGAQLGEGLRKLATRYPELVVEARSEGMMGGLELVPDVATESFVLRQFLENYGLVPPGVCHALFHHKVCLATTLNSRDTLRLSPPLVIEEEDLNHGLEALDSYLSDLQEGHVGRLGAFLADRVLDCDLEALRRSQLATRRAEFEESPPEPPPGNRPRVAFLVHANTPHYLDHFDPEIARFPADRLEVLARNLQAAIEPVLWHHFPLRHLDVAIFASPFLASQLARTGRRTWQHEVDLMVLAARSWGAELVGLGGLLSVVTRDGRTLGDRFPATTGNSLTTWASFQGVLQALERHHAGTRPRVEILGGYGNIGRAVAALALREGLPVRLFGNPRNPQRRPLLERTMKWLEELTGRGDLLLAGEHIEDHDGAPQVVVCCTSDPQFRLDLTQLAPGSSVLDLAIPPDLGRPEDLEVAAARDLHLYRAGLLASPEPIPSLEILELPEGLLYGCLAETLILGLSRRMESYSVGDLVSEEIDAIGTMALEHGFSPRLRPLGPA